MIKIVGNEIWRGGEKIGWVDGGHIRDHADNKVGFFDEKFVYNENDHKVAYIEGDFLYSEGGTAAAKIPLEKVAEDVSGGVIPGIARAAIYILLGS